MQQKHEPWFGLSSVKRSLEMNTGNVFFFCAVKSYPVVFVCVCRNYHVFYYLLAGASEEERKSFHLLKPEEYHYLNQVRTYKHTLAHT